MASDFDFKDLAQYALRYTASIVPELLSGGKMIGQEWVCGSKYGGPGDSMRVNMTTGMWADFATEERGGDLISLAACVNGTNQMDAAKWVARKINYRSIQNPLPEETKVFAGAPKVEDTLIVPPADYAPDFNHFRYGKPSMVWTYRTEDGKPWFWVARYDVSGHGKEFMPWSYSSEKRRAITKGWPRPRPLYNLHKLKERPTAPVLLVEGEKAVSGAERLGAEKNYVVTTWPNGAKSYKAADWKALKGRKILIWPDADEPGREAGNKIRLILRPIASEVKIINPDRDDGWDAWDAMTEEMTWLDVVQWAKKRVVVDIPEPEPEPVEETEVVEPEVISHTQNGVTRVEHDVALNDDRDPATGDQLTFFEQHGIQVNRSGRPYQNNENLSLILQHAPELTGKFWFDQFQRRNYTDLNGEVQQIDEMTAYDVARILQRKYGMLTVKTNSVFEAVLSIAGMNPRHEVQDYIKGCQWDGKHRVKTFFNVYFGVDDNDYVQAVSKNFWVGMVARIFRPGCKNDHMVVLEGAQGVGKSRAFGIIGGKWHSESTDQMGSKDFYQSLNGKMIVEIAELDSFSKADITAIKRVVTCQVDTYRASYARVSKDHPRQCIFVGTTNDHNYLRDHTGARRFWPLSCGRIDHEAIARDRDQIFAEAYYLFLEGDKWYEVPEDIARQVQEGRYQHDALEHKVQQYLETHDVKASQYIYLYDMMRNHLEINNSQADMRMQRRLATILRRLGWETRRVRVEGKLVTIWQPLSALTLSSQELFPNGADGTPFAL